MIVVVKIGTSSVTSIDGSINVEALDKLCGEVAEARAAGHDVVVVTSGAVTAGVATLLPGSERPTDPVTLQALSAIGQHRLMRVYSDALEGHGLACGQVLLAPMDLFERHAYLRARATVARLLDLQVVPVVNENDVVADDELRFGDNDRLAALVANLIGASLLVILTDTAGLFDADPRRDAHASLVAEVRAIDEALERVAGGAGSPGGRGGMASKLAAARIASSSGLRMVIAAAARPSVLSEAISGDAAVGTVFLPSTRRYSDRKLWIAFALGAKGSVVVDEGARRALIDNEASLLAAGVRAITGHFVPGDPIEICDASGEVFAKGIARLGADRSAEWLGRRTADLGEDLAREVVHRDDLVILV